jgi:hypothetical protein
MFTVYRNLMRNNDISGSQGRGNRPVSAQLGAGESKTLRDRSCNYGSVEAGYCRLVFLLTRDSNFEGTAEEGGWVVTSRLQRTSR